MLIFSLVAGPAVEGVAAGDAVFAILAVGDGAEFTCEFWPLQALSATIAMAIQANKRTLLKRNPDIVILSQLKRT